jgi:D-alanyl-D-alanine carboxypeptidase
VDNEGNPLLHSAAFMIADQATGNVLLEKNSDAVLPIASITKLMTAMVVLDARLSLSESWWSPTKTWTPCATAAPTCRWAPSWPAKTCCAWR